MKTNPENLDGKQRNLFNQTFWENVWKVKVKKILQTKHGNRIF